jgi:hypothetical protein
MVAAGAFLPKTCDKQVKSSLKVEKSRYLFENTLLLAYVKAAGNVHFPLSNMVFAIDN